MATDGVSGWAHSGKYEGMRSWVVVLWETKSTWSPKHPAAILVALRLRLAACFFASSLPLECGPSSDILSLQKNDGGSQVIRRKSGGNVENGFDNPILLFLAPKKKLCSLETRARQTQCYYCLYSPITAYFRLKAWEAGRYRSDVAATKDRAIRYQPGPSLFCRASYSMAIW